MRSPSDLPVIRIGLGIAGWGDAHPAVRHELTEQDTPEAVWSAPVASGVHKPHASYHSVQLRLFPPSASSAPPWQGTGFRAPHLRASHESMAPLGAEVVSWKSVPAEIEHIHVSEHRDEFIWAFENFANTWCANTPSALIRAAPPPDPQNSGQGRRSFRRPRLRQDCEKNLHRCIPRGSMTRRLPWPIRSCLPQVGAACSEA